MAIETSAIHVTDETTLHEVLDAAADGSVRIERDGVEYVLFRDTLNLSDEWDEKRAKHVRKVLMESAGMWKDVDLRNLIADIERRRGDDLQSSDCP